MQIEGGQSVCPACGAEGLEIFPVLHHMMCAYVGPQYDFVPAVDGYTCPKCRRGIVSGDLACDRGTSARCVRCGKEMVSHLLRRHPGQARVDVGCGSDPDGLVNSRMSRHFWAMRRGLVTEMLDQRSHLRCAISTMLMDCRVNPRVRWGGRSPGNDDSRRP